MSETHGTVSPRVRLRKKGRDNGDGELASESCTAQVDKAMLHIRSYVGPSDVQCDTAGSPFAVPFRSASTSLLPPLSLQPKTLAFLRDPEQSEMRQFGLPLSCLASVRDAVGFHLKGSLLVPKSLLNVKNGDGQIRCGSAVKIRFYTCLWLKNHPTETFTHPFEHPFSALVLVSTSRLSDKASDTVVKAVAELLLPW